MPIPIIIIIKLLDPNYNYNPDFLLHFSLKVVDFVFLITAAVV